MEEKELIQRLADALHKAETALSDIGDAERIPGDDVQWCKDRAAIALPITRSALNEARAYLAQSERAADLPPRVGHILRLAEIIHEVDGNNSLGASALAEAILRRTPAAAGLPSLRQMDMTMTDTTAQELIHELVAAWDSYSYADAGDATDRMAQAVTVARSYLAQPKPEGKVLAPIPISERFPSPEDCDAVGRCWVWNPETYWWELLPLRLITINAGDPYDYWLPHWAIPVPQEEP